MQVANQLQRISQLLESSAPAPAGPQTKANGVPKSKTPDSKSSKHKTQQVVKAEQPVIAANDITDAGVAQGTAKAEKKQHKSNKDKKGGDKAGAKVKEKPKGVQKVKGMGKVRKGEKAREAALQAKVKAAVTEI